MPIDPEFLSILVCVETKKPLLYVPAAGDEAECLFCPDSGLRYPFDEGGFPVLLADEAERVESGEADRLMERAERPAS